MVFLTSGDLTADRRYGFGQDLEARGDLAGAADLYAQAAEVAPGFASAWFALGEVLEKSGDRAGAISAFARAQAADPADHHGATLHLARLRASDAIAMPRAYVRTLFDQYAPRFDTALVGGLNYRAPALLYAAAARACDAGRRPMKFRTMLDLGCGTGLAAMAFRSSVEQMVGVDLSPEMVQVARNKALYDRLAVDDLATFLAEETARGGAADLVVAADVFVYLPDIALVASAVAQVLTPDGLFAFSVETHDGDGAVLGEKLRYAHGVAHVRAALAGAGLIALEFGSASTRDEGGVPVPGLVVVAKPA